MLDGLNNSDLESLQGDLNSLTPLDIKIEMFRQGDFDFIVEGIANNSEGDWQKGGNAKHLKQEEALKILTSNLYDFLFYGGSAGGAKSFTGMCWIVLSCLAYDNTRYFIARNELKDIRASVITTFYEVVDFLGIDKSYYHYNSVQSTIDFPKNKSHINLIEVKYKPSDPEYKDVGSTLYTSGWFEEVGEIHPKAVSVMQTRVNRWKVEDYGLTGIVFLTGNPSKNWTKAEYHDKHYNGVLKIQNNDPEDFNRKYLACLVVENPFISDKYIRSLRNQAKNDKSLYERLFKGNWDYDDNPNQLCEQECIDNVFDNFHVKEGKTYITADIALEGSDLFVIFVWKGWKVVKVLTRQVTQSAQIVSDLNYLKNEYRVSATRIMIDGDGMGSMLKGQVRAKFFRNGGRVVKTGVYTSNYRNISVQCLYYLAREIVNNDQMWIADESLTRDQKKRIKDELSQIIRVPNKQDFSKLDTKSKGEIKSDLGFSPDFLDCMKMRVWFDLNKELDLTCRIN